MTTQTPASPAALPTTPAGGPAAGSADQPVPARGTRTTLRRPAPAFWAAMLTLDEASTDGVDPRLAELVRLRASQINGCSYCIDQHSGDARDKGEPEHRLHALTAWRETPFFTPRERAALALTEAMTRVEQGVPDGVWDAAAEVFAPDELGPLVGLIVTINAWNRIGVGTRMAPPARD